MSSFILKIIACITMFIDHLGYVIYGGPSFFNYIGRIAFPIFAFQISQGYAHTKNLNKYIIRLFIFAVISQVPFYLFCSSFVETPSLNIFFTLILGLIAIISYDKIKNKFISLLAILAMCILADVLNVDYGSFGVLIIFTFYIFRNTKLGTVLAFLFVISVHYGERIAQVYITNYTHPNFSQELFMTNVVNKQLIYLAFNLLPLIPILLYNKKQGKKMKYFLYLFYPVHLLFLYIITTL